VQATEAVKQVYQYGSSIKGDPFKDLREKRAYQFRVAYGSDRDGHANEYPCALPTPARKDCHTAPNWF